MSASPEIAAAFEAWKLAELASHYAAPCPDEVMTSLVNIESDAFDALQAMPPANADDMLLKLFPILVREFEPQMGEPPLRLSQSRAYNYDAAFIASLNAQIGTANPVLAAAIAEPHYSATREAARRRAA